ncbi:MAG: PKD domain-containing protein, partial [Bacteroidales bacterium]|nr:PKD domain-containing protein [Bacteroidales bacterium]
YQWMVNEGSGWDLVANTGVYSNANTLTLNIDNAPLSMDGYLYRLRVSGKCSPEAYSQEVSLKVNANPAPSILPDPAAVSVAAALPLDGNPLSGSGVWDLHLWTGAVSHLDDVNVQTPVFTPSTIGDFELTYRVTDSNGCWGEDVVTVTVTSGIDVVLDDIELCADTDMQLTPGASGGSEVYVSHQWTGDGAVYLSDASIRNPVFHSADPGVYSLTYTVTDDYGTEGTETITVTVFERPSTAVSGDGDFPLVCGGTELQLNGNPSGGSGSYSVHTWSGQTMALSATDIADPVFSTMAAGTYTMGYRVTDSNGCSSDLEEIQVVNDIPSASFSTDAVPGCTPMQVTFTNNSLDAVAYEWDFGDGSDIVTDENPVHIFENLTTTIQYYTVTLTAFSANGCTHSSTRVITVYPGIDSQFTSSKEESCAPGNIAFNATPGALEYYWDFGDGNQGLAGPMVVHEFNNPSDDDMVMNVKLRTTSFYGCVDESDMDITIFATPRAEFSADPPLQKYPSSTVNFTNMGSTGAGFDHLWEFGDGNTSSSENPSHSYAEHGTFDVTLTVSNDNCVSTVTH